jgi:flagellar biosynthesis/type III secretory pathway chaperone
MLPSANPSENLLDLLSSQVGLLDQLLEIGKLQMHAIENGRMSELLSLLSDKQPLLADLGDMAYRIRNLPSHPLPASSDDDAGVQRCRELKAQAKEQFEQLFELEQKAEVLLSNSRDQIAKRLEASSHSMTAISAYQSGSTINTQGGRLDLSSDG